LRILVYRIGQLGDTVVALPALWAVRRQFPDARLVLLGNAHARFVQAQDVLPPSGLIDEYVTYPVGASRIAAFWGLLARLRASRFDALVYLAPRRRTRAQVWRDLAFFRLAGIRRVFGHHGFTPLPARPAGAPLPALEQEADHLLGRLASSGIPVPSRGRGEMDLALTGEERAAAESWLRAHVPADARGAGLVGIGPGSKQASKVWPEDRFVALGRRLVAEHRLFPVIFGGPEDRALGERLVRAWGRGSNAAGSLAIRVTAATLAHCRLYVGNDTGTMHLAAAVSVPCVAIFSARDWPGRWYPYGQGHTVLREAVSCEGCLLEVCTRERLRCLTGIHVDAVAEACAETLGNTGAAKW
jgi:heptosyltransferase-3